MAPENAKPTKQIWFFSIVKGLFLLFLAGYVVFFALNPKYLLERVTTIQTEQHDNLVRSRLAADSDIRLILSKTMHNTNADRAWLIEFHNGNKNLTTGLPFCLVLCELKKHKIVFLM